MKKYIIVAIISQLVTSLCLFQLFYYAMINATVTFGYTVDNRQIASVDLGVQQFNYWEE